MTPARILNKSRRHNLSIKGSLSGCDIMGMGGVTESNNVNSSAAVSLRLGRNAEAHVHLKTTGERF